MSATHPQRLYVLKELVKRDLEARYAGSTLGLAWSLVDPLWQLALFTFVFSVVMRVTPLGERTDNFAIFLFCGLLPWMGISEGVRSATTALTDHATIVKKLGFPTEILVLSAVLSALVRALVAGALFSLVLAATGHLFWRGLPLLAFALPVQVSLTAGLGLFAAAAHVFARDVSPFIGIAFQGWFYATPIVYPIALAPEPVQRWLLWNPLTGLTAIYRAAFLGGEIGWTATAPLLIWTAAALAIGVTAFWSTKHVFADEL